MQKKQQKGERGQHQNGQVSENSAGHQRKERQVSEAQSENLIAEVINTEEEGKIKFTRYVVRMRPNRAAPRNSASL